MSSPAPQQSSRVQSPWAPLSRSGLPWLLGALTCALLAVWLAPASDNPRPPWAQALGSLRLVRVQAALDREQPEAAVQLALDALDDDPASTAAWEYVLSILMVELSSSARVGDPATRYEWFRSGLDVAERGLESADEPERVALRTALLVFAQLQQDDPVPYPDGERGLGILSLNWLRRAADLGSSEADQLLDAVEDRVFEGPSEAR